MKITLAVLVPQPVHTKKKMCARQSLQKTFPVVSSRDFRADRQDVSKESNGCKWQLIPFSVLARHTATWFFIELGTEYISFILVSGKFMSSWK